MVAKLTSLRCACGQISERLTEKNSLSRTAPAKALTDIWPFWSANAFKALRDID
jgi:hypothetical protein